MRLRQTASIATERLPEICYVVILYVLLLFVHLALFDYACDDAYIHFRIARNFVTQGVPYFNLGEPVMASSSPGWTLLLSLVFFLFGVRLKLVAVINSAAIVLTVVSVAHLFRKVACQAHRDLRPTLTATAVVLVSCVYASLFLMETPAAMLFFVLGINLITSEKSAGFALLLTAVFFRPEMGLFFVGALCYQIARGKFDTYCLLWILIVGIPFLTYEMYFFHTVIPMALAAKSVVYDLSFGDTWGALQFFFMPKVFVSSILFTVFRLIMVGTFIEMIRLVIVNYRSMKDLLGLVILPAMGIIVFYFVSRTFLDQWYWYVPCYFLPLAISVVIVLMRTQSRVLGVLAVACMLPYLVEFGGLVYGAARQPEMIAYFQGAARVRQYLAVGSSLYRTYPEATLLSSEIGGLGYSFHGEVFDAVGLTDPRALKYHPMRVPEERIHGSIGAIPVGYVKEMDPDIIVSLDIFFKAVLKSPLVERYFLYRLPIYLESDMRIARQKSLWDSTHLNVLIRKEKVFGRPWVPDP